MADPLLESVRNIALALQQELDQLLAKCSDWSDAEQVEFLEAPVAKAMTECLGKLAATGCVGSANQLPSQVLWNIAGNLLRHGELQLRAREKPRGYAGDDALLRRIFSGEVSSHPLGRAFDRFFLSQDAPRAVIERTVQAANACHELLIATKLERECRIAVIGSGPALEIELVLRQWAAVSNCSEPNALPELMHVTLLDLDELALDAARERLSHMSPNVQIVALRENLFRLGKQPKRALPLANSDLIICLGFLDYLSAEDASSLLRVCFQSLKPGGRMLFGNFSPQCQARTYMEWIGNWYLNYRTASEFRSLAQAAEIDERLCHINGVADTACLLLMVQRA